MLDLSFSRADLRSILETYVAKKNELPMDTSTGALLPLGRNDVQLERLRVLEHIIVIVGVVVFWGLGNCVQRRCCRRRRR